MTGKNGFLALLGMTGGDGFLTSYEMTDGATELMPVSLKPSKRFTARDYFKPWSDSEKTAFKSSSVEAGGRFDSSRHAGTFSKIIVVKDAAAFTSSAVDA